MTIDEAIKKAEEVAEENKKIRFKKGGKGGWFYEDTDWDTEKCAKEHRQLASWLRELKQLRQAVEDIRVEISDFEEEIFYRSNTDYSDYAAVRHCLDIINRHLKEGEE